MSAAEHADPLGKMQRNSKTIQAAGVDGCEAGWVVTVVTATAGATHDQHPLFLEALEVSLGERSTKRLA